MSAIPRRLSHIWIGPRPAPLGWMESWPRLHPGWSYTVYGNDTLVGYPFRLRALMNEYAWRGAWAGVQDMMRYELLFRFGGFMADADAICLHPVDELLDAPRAYTVHDRLEGDPMRAVCPILACEPGNPFVGAVIDRLATLAPWELRKPEVSTGNRFLRQMIRELAPGPETLRIWPTHYFVPWQKNAPDVWYDGPDRVYAEQKWGTSTWAYDRAEVVGDPPSADDLRARAYAIMDRLAGAWGDLRAPDPDRDAARLAQAAAVQSRAAEVLGSDQVKADFADLGQALTRAMKDAGRPARFQGLHFFRHMQNTPLTDGKLMTRAHAVREALLGWLGSARRALVVGYDTGHLLAAGLALNPGLSVQAMDAMRWPVEKDPDPPRRRDYVPAAADWLRARFGDRLRIGTGDEAAFLADPTTAAGFDAGADLLLLSDVDLRAMAVIQAARPLLSPGAVIVAASPGDGAARLVDRLRVQGMIYPPIRQETFRSGASLAVMRLI